MGYIVLERQQPRRALVAFKAARAIRQDLGSKAYEMMEYPAWPATTSA